MRQGGRQTRRPPGSYAGHSMRACRAIQRHAGFHRPSHWMHSFVGCAPHLMPFAVSSAQRASNLRPLCSQILRASFLLARLLLSRLDFNSPSFASLPIAFCFRSYPPSLVHHEVHHARHCRCNCSPSHRSEPRKLASMCCKFVSA